MARLGIAWSASLLANIVVPALDAAPAAALQPCAAGLTVRFDRQGGTFDGLSQSGVLLVLRNIGSTACSMPGLPVLRFDDGAGQALAVVREPPLRMHPGPVVTAVGLRPGAEASAALHWVSGDVFDGHHCVTPARVAVGEGQDAATGIWLFGPLCGQAGKPIVFRQTVLRTGAAAAP